MNVVGFCHLDGDFDGDDEVGITDIVAVAEHWGMTSEDPFYYDIYDHNHDGDIDIIFHFKTQELDLDSASVEAILQGSTFEGPDI